MSKSERVDEIAPIVAGVARLGAGALRAVGSAIKSYAKKKAMEKAMEKAKEKAEEKLIGKKEEIQEDLRKWVQEKWVDIGAPDGKGGYKPCGRSKGEKRKGYPKCVPLSKARSMSKGQKRSAVKRKRAAGNAGPKPTMVKTMKEERMQSLQEKLCARGKAAAKRKFKVYPSAYANMYASAVCSGKVTPGGKKKQVVSHTVYHDMGMIIAEEMGLVKKAVKAVGKMARKVARKVGDKVVASGNKKIRQAETGEASGADEREVKKIANSGHRRLRLGQAIQSLGGKK